jgi:hypothetical protein
MRVSENRALEAARRCIIDNVPALRRLHFHRSASVLRVLEWIVPAIRARDPTRALPRKRKLTKGPLDRSGPSAQHPRSHTPEYTRNLTARQPPSALDPCNWRALPVADSPFAASCRLKLLRRVPAIRLDTSLPYGDRRPDLDGVHLRMRHRNASLLRLGTSCAALRANGPCRKYAPNSGRSRRGICTRDPITMRNPAVKWS